jgi:hypothetical protein
MDIEAAMMRQLARDALNTRATDVSCWRDNGCIYNWLEAIVVSLTTGVQQ